MSYNELPPGTYPALPPSENQMEAGIYMEDQQFKQPKNVVHTIYTEPFSTCTLVTSVCSVFCCSVLGIPAMVCALMSYSDHAANNMVSYRSRKNTACCLAGTAMAAMVVGFIIFCIIIGVSYGYIMTFIEKLYKGGSDEGGSDEGGSENYNY